MYNLAGLRALSHKLCLTAVFLAFSACVPASHGSTPSYTLKRTELSPGGLARLQLREAPSGRVIWTRTVREVNRIGWSKDHRALAVSIGDRAFGREHYRFLLWRAGQPARLVRYRNEPYADYGILCFAWSPDHRRLLYRQVNAGAYFERLGSLWCMDVSSLRQRSVTDESVRSMHWVGRHRFAYQTVKGVWDKSHKRLTWPVPAGWHSGYCR